MNLDDLSQLAAQHTPPAHYRRWRLKAMEAALPAAFLASYMGYRLTSEYYWFAAAPIVCAALYFYHPLRLRLAASARRGRIETELPFAAVVLAVASPHTPPLTALKTLARTPSPSLSQTQDEYHEIVKAAKLSRSTLARAASECAERNPSARFQAFLRTVSAAERGVGDTVGSLRDFARTELHRLSAQVELSSEKLGVASSVVLVSFSVAPLTTLIFAAITGQPKLALLTLALALPAAVAVNSIVDQAFPSILRPSVPAPSPWVYAVFAAGAAAAAEIYFKAPVPRPAALFLALVAATLAPAAYFRSASRRHERLIRSMPSIARDLAEESKKGVPPSVALTKIAKSGKYPAEFVQSLSRETPGSAYIVEAYRDLLAYSERLGVNPEDLEQVADAVNAASNTHSSYSSKASFFEVTAYVSSAILAAAVAAVLKTFNTLFHATRTAYLPATLTLIHPDLGLGGVMFSAVLVDSYLLGLLAGKARRGSVLLGFREALVSLAAAAATMLAATVV